MIAGWTMWKRYPDALRGESIEAPIGPGLYEVRHAATGAVFACGATNNVALELAQLAQRAAAPRWFARRKAASLPALEYRTCATDTFANAKSTASHLFGRREVFMSGAA